MNKIGINLYDMCCERKLKLRSHYISYCIVEVVIKAGWLYNVYIFQVCRERGIDCIVAPYEADAQLAFLNKAGIAQVIVTEDSDLLLFGCDRVCKIKTLKECPV